ncbi:adenylate/guanylate cyclase domain-containing protein [Thermodesulfobacteriota bacterium]
MTEDRAKRKLTAILSADVKGYSRLMGENELATVDTLKKYREVLASLVNQYNGRVVDSPGDNLLAEFASIVDAVECAVKIQGELGNRNTELPENRRMDFRIGINLGDVIDEGERIYGDGINIAARIEGLADAGGVSISRNAYDQVKNKLAFGYEYQGEFSVKNISESVKVYRVVLEAEGGNSKSISEHSLPDKPSIAVLPFENMSGDTEQEYFSDGITEDLITDLSKISGLLVIARNSVFTYKGKPVKVQEVGRELRVRYVLEGSVRKAGNRVRITAQLIDTETGGHLWAERYDRDLDDIFALQDEVAQKIVKKLAVKLAEEEEELLARKYTNDTMAYDLYLRGLESLLLMSEEENLQARQMFEKAVDRDSDFAAAYAYMGLTHWVEWSLGWSQDQQTLERAYELSKKSLELDNSLPAAHRILGEVYLWDKKHERAIEEFEKSIALNPNDADSFAALGNALNWAGKPEEVFELVNKAMRLNPIYPFAYLWVLGHAYYLTKQYEDAIATLKRVLKRGPNFHPPHAYLAGIYSELDRVEEAKAEWDEFVKGNPQTSLDAWKHRLPYKDHVVLERLFGSLRKAGLG